MKKELEQGVKFSELGIGAKFEDDRFELDERGAMQITRYRVDTKTKYYDALTKEGGILKFDGFDIATGERIKYRTTSRVILETVKQIGEKVGQSVDEDEDGNIWYILKKPVLIDGIEKVKSQIKGRNPYLKVLIS